LKRIETVAIVGLGAIGAMLLEKISLTLPPENIRAIVSGERAGRYRENPVTVNGKQVNFRIRDPKETGESVDLLIFAVKHSQLETAIKDAENSVGENTLIISLLNGIISENIISAAFGREKVLYAYAVGTDSTRRGNDIIYKTFAKIPFGEARNIGRRSERVSLIEEFFNRTGIPYEIPEDMIKSLWAKFMMNVGVNQLSAVLGATYSAFQKPGAARDLFKSAMMEVVFLSRLEGINLNESDADKAIQIIDSISPEGKTSMLQDMEAGRKTEAGIFGGTVLELSRKFGASSPVNEVLVRLIRAREEAF
jgi:2-dehydropantoate 2-reductase